MTYLICTDEAGITGMRRDPDQTLHTIVEDRKVERLARLRVGRDARRRTSPAMVRSASRAPGGRGRGIG